MERRASLSAAGRLAINSIPPDQASMSSGCLAVLRDQDMICLRYKTNEELRA